MFSRTTLALVAIAALGAGACDKGSKSGGNAAAKGMSGASAVAPNGGLKRALSMMPANSEFVIALDWNQARSSALWKKYEAQVMSRAGSELAKFKEVCGWDPIAKATGALIAGRGEKGDEVTGFVRGFDKASVTDCLKKVESKNQAEANGKTLVADGDYFELGSGDPSKVMRFIFADDQTILFQVQGGRQMADKAALQAILAAKEGDGLMSSDIFASLINATDTSATMWFAVKGLASFVQNAGLPFKFIAAFGSVRAVDGVDGKITVRMTDSATASSISGMASMAMTQVQGTPYADYAKKVKIDTNGPDLRVTFQFTAAQLDSMAEQAKSLPF